jgi:hypothetical protein
VILLVAGFSLLTLLAYPAQLRRLPRRTRWLPPSLRILAITAIALSILRPVVTRARIASERAPVVVLIDNSRSMSVVDSNRSPGEWVGIAAAMGRVPADARDKKIAALQADCDRLSAQADEVTRARAELEYARLSGRGIDAAQERLDQTVNDFQATARDATAKNSGIPRVGQLEKSLAYMVRIPARMDREVWLKNIAEKARSAATDAESARLDSDRRLYLDDEKIRQACQPLQSLSRLQVSESSVLDPVNGLLARLGPETSVQLFGVCDQPTPVPIDDAARSQEPLAATGNFSDLTGGMREILESLKTAPPRAVVLFTDGRLVNAQTDPATLAALQGIPIFTVGVSARAGLKDLSILNATVPANAIVGETITFKADLRCLGMPGTSTDLTFTDGGTEQTRRISFPDDRMVPVSFTAMLKQPGIRHFTLELGGVPGEASYENNRVDRWVNVSASTTRPAGAKTAATRPTGEAEMSDLIGDEYWLRKISDSSGGQFYRLDQVDLLPKRLNDLRDDVNRPIEVPLWDGPYLFLLVLGCLSAEWGIRKRYGLA